MPDAVHATLETSEVEKPAGANVEGEICRSTPRVEASRLSGFLI